MRIYKALSRILCLTVLSVTMLSETALAATKNISVSVDDDYENGTFVLNFEESGEYGLVLLSPDGTVYDYEKKSDTQMECYVGDINAGVWTTEITTEGNEEIGEVKVSVITETEEETQDVGNTIQVGKNIAGLDMYFKDSCFIVTWTDDACGNVDIEIVNLNTSQVIESKRVAEKEFSCSIPENVKNIVVTIVPSESANVDGAELRYVYEVKRELNGKVEFPNIEETNLDTITADVTLNHNLGIIVEVDGVQTASYENQAAGVHTIDIPLNEDGEHEVKVYIVDADGNMNSKTAEFVKDSIAPMVEMQEEYDGIKTTEESITIAGYVRNYDAFSINGDAVDVKTDGYFEMECSLHEGTNEILIEASDNAGNITSYNASVMMYQKNDSEYGRVVLLIIGIVAAIIFIRKDKKKKHKDDDSTITIQNNTPNLAETVNLNTDKDNKSKKKSFSVPLLQREQRAKEKVNAPSKKAVFEKLAELMQKRKTDLNRPVTKKDGVKAILVAVFVFLIFTFVLFLGTAASGSMENTIKTGDICISNRLAYVSRAPQRGDIIYFRRDDKTYGKRVVGIAGDSIEFVDGYVYINGERYIEDYIPEDVETNCNRKFEVPDGHVFVMGDNREDSLDSRYWENPYVSEDEIVAKYMLLIPTHIIYDLFVEA